MGVCVQMGVAVFNCCTIVLNVNQYLLKATVSLLSNVGSLKIEIGVKKVFMWMNIIYSWYVVIKQLDLKELPFTLPRLMYSQLMCVLCGHGVGGHHLEFFGHCKMVAICGERSLKDKIQSLNTLGSLTAPT